MLDCGGRGAAHSRTDGTWLDRRLAEWYQTNCTPSLMTQWEKSPSLLTLLLDIFLLTHNGNQTKSRLAETFLFDKKCLENHAFFYYYT